MLGRVHEIIVRTRAPIYTGALDIESPGNLQGMGEARVVTEGACAEFSRELQKIYKSFGGTPGQPPLTTPPPPPRRPLRGLSLRARHPEPRPLVS